MGKIVILAVLIFLPLAVFIFFSPVAFAISISPSSATDSSLIILGDTNGLANDLTIFPAYDGCFDLTGNSCKADNADWNGFSVKAVFGGSMPAGDYTIVGDTTGDCQSYNLSLSDCLLIPGNTSAAFTIAVPAAGVSVSERPNSGGFVIHMPDITLLTRLTGKSLRGTIEISYIASDKDDEISSQQQYGLRKGGPVDIFLGHGEWPNFYWELLADRQSATGTFAWDTTKIPNGKYRFKVKAWGADGNSAEVATEDFIIDNTPPNFTVSVSPEFSLGEPVKIQLKSSESLKSVPTVTVTQFGHDPVKISPITDKGDNVFIGTYRVLNGFDGPAKISVVGEDKAGNLGAIVVGADTFAVGIKPPAMPVIETPFNNSKTTSSTLQIVGHGLNIAKVVAKVNGGQTYAASAGQDGRFRIEGVKLEPNFNRGNNVISVVTYDPAGRISMPANLDVYLNSPPKLTLLQPSRRRSRFSDKISVSWLASDANDDPLTYAVELTNDGGKIWKIIADNLKKSELAWDSKTVPDGSNYGFRITASDGLLTSAVASHTFTIFNDLPTLIWETQGDFFTAETSRLLRGIVQSKNDFLEKLEWSVDDGKTWQVVLPDDGRWDSNFERFGIKVPFAQPGAYHIALRGITVSGRNVANAEQIRMVFDNKPPTLEISAPKEKLTNAPYLAQSGSAGDTISGIGAVEYAIDDSPWYQASIESGFGEREARFNINHADALADGRHEIKARAVDRASNYSSLRIWFLTIDATPPRIGSFTIDENGRILFPNASGTFEIPPKTPLRLRFALRGEPKIVEAYRNGDKLAISYDSSRKIFEGNVLSGDEGGATIKIKAEDKLGNKVERELTRFYITPTSTAQAMTKSNNTIGSFLEKIRRFFFR